MKKNESNLERTPNDESEDIPPIIRESIDQIIITRKPPNDKIIAHFIVRKDKKEN